MKRYKSIFKENSEVISLDENNVKAYLDKCIEHWRNSDLKEKACYIDAFQSVRMSLFGKLLPLKEATAQEDYEDELFHQYGDKWDSYFDQEELDARIAKNQEREAKK